MVIAVETADIVDDLAAAVDAEVHVDIRHGHALRVQKALKKEAVFYRVDIGDMQAVGHDAARGAAAPGADGDAVSLGVADEVRNDQKVIHKAHAVDDIELIFKLGVYLGPVGKALGKALFAQLFKVLIAVGLPLGELEARQEIVPELEIIIAARGDIDSVVRRLRHLRVQRAHLLLTLEVEFLRLEAHTPRVVDGLAHLDAHEDVLIIGVLFLDIVRVVCHDKGDAGIAVQADKLAPRGLLILDAVILDLKIEIILPEKLLQLQRLGLRGLIVTADEPLGNVPRKAAGQAYEPLGVLVQNRPVYARLNVKALGEARGDEVAEVAVACLILAQEDQVRIVIVNAVLLIAHVARRDIDLAADDRLYARGLAGTVEIDSTVHYAVIGDRDGVLPQLLYTLRQLFDAAGAVEQGILAMHMKMNERHIFILSRA